MNWNQSHERELFALFSPKEAVIETDRQKDGRGVSRTNGNIEFRECKGTMSYGILLDCCLIQHSRDWDPVKLLHSGDC